MRAFTAGVVFVAGVVFAAPASADQYDYMMYLDANGVSYGSMDIVGVGKAVCRALRSELPVKTIMVELVQTGGFPPMDAGHIVAGASGFMCPDTMPYVEEQVASFYGGHIT